MAGRAGNQCYAPRGVGEIQYIELADPAAGNPFIFTMADAAGDVQYIARLIFLRFQFVTDATAPARFVTNYSTHGDAPYNVLNEWRPPAADTQAASLTRQYVYQPGLPFHNLVYASGFHHYLPADVWLLPGARLSQAITAIAAGDQISNVKIGLQRWQVG